MKYLLPIAAVATGLIVYAVIRAKHKEQWIPITANTGKYTLGNGHWIHMHEPHIAMELLKQKRIDEVGY